jgi:hypothetical protein
MQPHERNEQIDAAVEAIAYGVYDSGALYDPHRWWPRSYVPYSPLFAADFHGRWVTQWRRLPRLPAAPYARATAIWVLLAMASRSLKAMFEVHERCEIFLDLLDDIQHAKSGDIFCRDGANQVLEQSQAQATVDRLPFQDASSPSVDRAYSILNATLLAYSEAVFFSANCTVREVHGPYNVNYQGQRCRLVIRDYYRLRDEQLEPETAKCKLDSVSAYSLYDESVHFSFSVVNDYTTDSPLKNHTVAHAAELSSKAVTRLATNVDDIRHVTDDLGTIIAKVSEQIRHAKPLDQTVEILRRTYYRASPIARAAEESWEPSPVFVKDFVGKLSDFNSAMPPEMTRKDFCAMVDPRL